MAIQKSPHTNTQQNRRPEETDMESPEQAFETDPGADQKLYENESGAEKGANRSPREIQTRVERHRVEPEQEAHEGSIGTRTPKRPAQGITAHSSEQESERQKKVADNRPDAQAGVNRSKRGPTG